MAHSGGLKHSIPLHAKAHLGIQISIRSIPSQPREPAVLSFMADGAEGPAGTGDEAVHLYERGGCRPLPPLPDKEERLEALPLQLALYRRRVGIRTSRLKTLLE